jgi:hypothetical protein
LPETTVIAESEALVQAPTDVAAAPTNTPQAETVVVTEAANSAVPDTSESSGAAPADGAEGPRYFEGRE